MEELSGMLTGTGERTLREKPPPVEANPPGRGRTEAGPGWPRAGFAAFPTLIGCWSMHVTQAGALLPTQWN